MTVAPDYHSELYELAGAQCEGAMMADQAARLEELVLGDGRLRRQYILYMQVHAYAEKNAGRGARGEGRRMAGSPAIDLSVSAGVAVELPLQLDLEPQIPNPPFPLLSTTHYPLPADFVGSWAFACMVATVIVGAMLLVFWAIEVTHYQHIAEAPSQSVPSDARPEMVFVGRITGMVDVKWSDATTAAVTSYVALGRKYALASGLMEITYDTGAKVILQGPCTYEAESTSGGYLSLGKLTAKVEAVEGKGSRSKVQGSRSASLTTSHQPLATNSNPQSLIPNPLFSIRTPTALVTDLGTEFGVEVSEGGTTTSRVFRGSVKVLVLGGTAGLPSSGREVVLGENESARVQHGRVALLARPAVGEATENTAGQAGSATPAFVRRMPKWVPIKLFNTGIGLKEGDEDPHWQLVARSDAPDFQPQPAVVTAALGPAGKPEQSQWISTADGPPILPNNVTYTFRTTFEFTDALPGTAVLRGRFIADNHVMAIRLNGKQLDVPEHGDCFFDQFSEFSAAKGFVPGTNTLEIDVYNDVMEVYYSVVRPLWALSDSSPMGLRVELSGSVVSEKKGG